MKSIIMVAVAGIKKKKLQNMLVALIILVAALIFTTSIGILGGINKPYENMHKKLNASHLGLFFDNRMHHATDIMEWWKKQEGVSSVSSIMTCVLVENPIRNGKELDIEFYMTEVPSSVKNHDKLICVEGAKKDYPGYGEVWIPTALAYNEGIKVGDKLKIPLSNGQKELLVSAIVVDPVFSTSMINPTRTWVAPGALSLMYSANSLNNVFLGIRYADLSYENQLWEAFEEYMGKPFSGVKFTYSLVSAAFLMMYQLIGFVLLLFSVILLVVAVYILYATISDAVMSDYKTIGILKSQGFTPRNITFIYVSQMALVSILAIPLGIGMSVFVIRKILESLMKSLGAADLSMPLLLPFILSFVVMLGLILLSTFISARKAGNVKPAHAIKYGAPPEDRITRRNSKAIMIRNIPVVAFIGINQLVSSKKQIVFSFITFCATVFVLIIGVNSYHSLDKMADNRAFLGFDDSDVTMIKKGKRFAVGNNELLKKVKGDDRVKDVLPSGYLLTGVVPGDDKRASFNIIGVEYDGDMDAQGLKCIEGKNPETENEIALAKNTSKDYNIKVGDKFDLFVEGKLVNYKVSGIYQGVNNMGQGYRLQTSAVKAVNPIYESSVFLVKLKAGVDKEQFMLDMKKSFGEAVDVKDTSELYGRYMKPIVSNMGAAIVLISVIFILVLMITIFSSTLLSVHKQKKNFGIFKTLGMTPVQIRFSIVLRYMMIGMIAIAIGIGAGVFLTPKLLTAMCSGMGIVNFPTVTNVTMTLLVVPVSMVLAFISSWIPSGQILKVNPRELVSE